MDGGATRPRFQPQEQLAQESEKIALPTSTAASPADGETLIPLIGLPSESAAPGADPSQSTALPPFMGTAEVAPAPAPVVAVAALAHYQRLERILNFVIALVAIVVAAPLMLLVAIAVRLSSSGPILYRQPRVGLNRRGQRLYGRRRIDKRWHLWSQFLALHDDQRGCDLGGAVFMIYKFRTMCEGAEGGTGAVWAVRDDPRTTIIGCFLRKYRLDELPQLFNVLKGDMNIVGPRPERPSIFAQLREQVESYPLRQRAKPGITGWAQINLLYDACIEDVRKKIRYDLEYLRQKSILHDLKIMAKTLPSVLFKRRGW